MNQIKGNLTRLKNRISEKIQEEADVLGFAGVNKRDLLGFIDRAYGLTTRLESIRGTFAIVSLKRKISRDLEHCKEALDESTGEQPDKAKFDQFLSALTRIHDEIYLTYVVHCSDGLNLAADIGKMTESVDGLKGDLAQIQPEAEQLILLMNSLDERNDKSAQILVQQQEKNEQAESILTDIEKAKTSALASAEVLTKYENNAKNEQDTINSLARKASKTDQHIKQVMAEVTDKTKKIDETVKSAYAAKELNEKQQSEINKTLDAASKYGMAASFKERKDELKLPMFLWSIVFVVAICGLFGTAAKYIVPTIKDGKVPEITEIVIKLTLVSPLIWLGWMAAKQYGYIARIREDYSFKYASALAFEGYKKEASNVDRAILRDLLNVATSNMALNPLRIYSHDDNDASPLHDAFARFMRSKSSNKPETSAEE